LVIHTGHYVDGIVFNPTESGIGCRRVGELTTNALKERQRDCKGATWLQGVEFVFAAEQSATLIDDLSVTGLDAEHEAFVGDPERDFFLFGRSAGSCRVLHSRRKR